MKKVTFIMMLISICSQTIGQHTTIITTTTTKTDTISTDSGSVVKTYGSHNGHSVHHTSVKIGFHNRDKTAYFGINPSIEIGWNRFMDNGSMSVSKNNADLTLKKGNEFVLNVLSGYVYLNRQHRLRLSTALGLDYNTYHFERNITLLKNQDSLTIVTDNSKNFTKNLLRSTYLTLPLTFTIRPVSDSKFEIALGAEGGLLLGAKTKQINAASGKVKVKGDFNLNPVRYGLRFGIGYEGIGLYAKYYLSDVFAPGQGPKDFRTVSIGINFGIL